MGLEFSHQKGIIHRDLKPGNVWLAEDGRAMIGDFGLAVAIDRSRLTQAGMMVGTVNYMPPEQAMGGEVTPQSDLYSLGAMLYEMVCGRPPFVGDDHVAIIGQHLNTPPVAPSWHRPDCPAGARGADSSGCWRRTLVGDRHQLMRSGRPWRQSVQRPHCLQLMTRPRRRTSTTPCTIALLLEGSRRSSSSSKRSMLPCQARVA